MTISLGVVAAIHVRGDPCGAVRSPPDDDLLRSKHAGVPLSIFIVF